MNKILIQFLTYIDDTNCQVDKTEIEYRKQIFT